MGSPRLVGGFFSRGLVLLIIKIHQNPEKTDEQYLIALNTELYTKRVMRQLTNYNRILDERMNEFYKKSFLASIKSRMVFLFPDVNDFDEYISRKIQDKKKLDQLQKAKSIVKIISCLVMSVSFILVGKTLDGILKIKTSSYVLAKNRKEKAKRKKKRRKRNSRPGIELL